MSKGFVLDAGGEVLIFGHRFAGTKADDLADRPGNEFVTAASDKPRYDALFEEMQNPTPPPLPDVNDIPLTDIHRLEILLTRPANTPNPSEERAQRERMRDRGEA